MRAMLLVSLALAACTNEPANSVDPAPEGNVASPDAPAAAAAAGNQAAVPEASVVAGDGQNFTMAADGPLKIVGSETQYDIVLPADVLFDFDRAELRPEATPLLEKVKAHLDANGSDQLHVRGYTDAKGEDQYNSRLSMRRAASVCDWLKARGETFTNCIGRGEADPIAPNANPDGSDNPMGRQLNRRVTVSVVKYPDVNAMMDKARAQADAARR